jgi:hypothetical protein
MKSANGFFVGNVFESVGTFHPLAKKMCHTHGGNLLSEMRDSSIWHYKTGFRRAKLCEAQTPDARPFCVKKNGAHGVTRPTFHGFIRTGTVC